MKDINTYKTKLEEEKKILLEELSSIAQKDVDDGDWEAKGEDGTKNQEVEDEADMAERGEEYVERVSVTEQLEKRLEDIELSLSKIENDNYGVCEVCGVEIEEDRLEANPSARTCKKCMNS